MDYSPFDTAKRVFGRLWDAGQCALARRGQSSTRILSMQSAECDGALKALHDNAGVLPKRAVESHLRGPLLGACENIPLSTKKISGFDEIRMIT